MNAELFGSHASGPAGRHPWAAASSGPTATSWCARTSGAPWTSRRPRGTARATGALEYSPSPGLMLFQNGRLFAEDRENGTPAPDQLDPRDLPGRRPAGQRARAAASGRPTSTPHLDDFESTFSAVAPDRASETLSLAQAVDYKDVGGNLQWTRPLGASHQLGIGGDVRWIEADNKEDVYIAPGDQRSRPADPGPAALRRRLPPGRGHPGAAGGRDPGPAGDHWRNYDASQTEIVNSTGATTVTPYADTSKTRVTPRGGVLVHLSDALRAARLRLRRLSRAEPERAVPPLPRGQRRSPRAIRTWGRSACSGASWA